MRIITNADDFGCSDETVEATIECFEARALTSATIMPRMPATERALEFARKHPEHSFGVHLTYVSDGIEAPVLPPSEIPALVAKEGQFKNSNVVRVMALLDRFPVDQIERETEAQIRRVIDAGVPVSHVDSHGHLHKFGPFREALRRVLPRLGLRRVRNVQDVYLERPWKSVTYWLGPVWRARIEAAFQTTDHFYMPMGADETAVEPILSKLRAVDPEKTLEIGVHPGRTEAWRDLDRRFANAFAEPARRAGHTLIGWRSI